MITREEFVKICSKAICDCREKIAISNQVSGYLKYHNEIKNHDYFLKLRQCKKTNYTRKFSLYNTYFITKHGKMGYCAEIARYLAYILLKKLKIKNVKGKIYILSSRLKDHAYLNISVFLKNEKKSSLWEIDAWDPRIIDISLRPDNTVKNYRAIKYGYGADIKHTISLNQNIIKNKNISFSLFPPQEGPPSREATPEHEVLDKHEKIYSDLTVESAFRKRKLDPEGKIHYLQAVSKWQKL